MALSIGHPKASRNKQFRVLMAGCPHPQSDLGYSRESITLGLECNVHGLDCDIAVINGDFSSGSSAVSTPTDDAEGLAVKNQLCSNKWLTRNKIYTIRGNHDAGDLNYNWYNKWVDNRGENTATSGVDNSLRPYALNYLTDDCEYFFNGTLLFILLNDRNEMGSPCGRSGNTGGFPSGTISRVTWNAIVNLINTYYTTHNIFICNHHLPKDTTIATGDNEGVNGGFHVANGILVGTGRLESIWDDSNSTYTDSTEIINWLNANQGKIFMWIGTHTHYLVNETYNGRSSYILKYGTHFLNTGSLSRHHIPKGQDSISRLFVFHKGSTTLNILQYGYSCNVVPSNAIYKPNELELTMPYNFIP